MSLDRIEQVWMSGKMVPWKDALVHVSVHTLHLGSGIFEAMRCYETPNGPAVFRLDAHLDRFYSSAEVYHIEPPFTREQLAEAVCETIRRNGLKACYVRLLCYYGCGSLGVFPRNCPTEVAILAWPLKAYLKDEGLVTGVRVTISSWVKFHSSAIPTTAKACGQYLNSLLAMRDALSRGFDEALLLDVHGNIAEGSGENIFLVRQDKLLTNDENSSILLGITRDAVIQIARDLGYSVHICALTKEDLYSSDEAFFTGTAIELTPIREVDGVTLGSGTPGPVTTRIQQAFFAAVTGREPRYKRWLHFVS